MSSINEWYGENIGRFPDLVEGECSHCGIHKMIIDYEDGGTECYHCGATSEVLDS